MSVVELPVTFECQGDRLLGIMTAPAAGLDGAQSAVVIVTGGPQYRAGSHRQFVQTSRALAAGGHAVLRFDARGTGDSTGDQRAFDSLTHDIEAAVAMLRNCTPQVRQVALLGLCDGASAALLYLHESQRPRVDALCLLNPWVRSPATLARTQVRHYYVQRLVQRAFWRKLLKGGVGMGRVIDLALSLGTGWLRRRRADPTAAKPTFQDAMRSAWQSFQGPILLVLSAADLTAMEFVEQTQATDEWRGLLTRPTVTRIDIEGADHTLSDPAAQTAFERALLAWMASSCGSPEPR